MIWIYSILSVIVVSLISLVGAFTISINEERLHKMLLGLVSLSVGALFGDVFIHILPEAFETGGGALKIGSLVFLGILIFFTLEKFLRWGHGHDPHEHGAKKHIGQINLVSDGLHNLIDGAIIGASYMVSIPVGLATTLAVILHEIPQEIGDFGLLIHSGYARSRALFLNLMSGLLGLVGVLLALFLGGYIEGFTAIALPLTAGGFIYIAGSDLVPELQKVSDKRTSFIQFVSIIAGFVLLALLLLLE